MMKIGALSSQTGLTVRTLHHYDDLGLLCPSHRSDSGFRLYTDADVVRLHRIQALKQMGCSLAEIKAALDGPPCSGQDMVARQMTVLRDQQRQLAVLIDRLGRLQRKMDQGKHAAVADWLAVLEMMMMQEKHLSPSEMTSLQASEDREGVSLGARWQDLVTRVQTEIDNGTAPDTDAAQALSWEWIKLGNQMVGADTQLAVSLAALQHAEPRAQAINGITPAVMAWITKAFANARAALIAPYVSPEEFALVRERMLATMADWPALFAEAGACLNEGLAPDHARVADLVDRWQALFRKAHSGGDDALDAKVQRAFHNEPDLMIGMGVNTALLTYVGHAMALRQRAILPAEGDGAAAASAPKPTAYLTATQRALHQLVDDPIVFRDPLAVRVLGPDADQALQAQKARAKEPMMTGLRATVVVRARVVEDAWAEAQARGVRQYVVLGAGLDTFAYRQAAGFNGRVFEVDLPATQQWKRHCLTEASIAEPPCLSFVGIDFEQSTLAQSLADAGFRRDEPAFFSWLGVTQYLDEPDVWRTLSFIASCAPGSGVVFDFSVPMARLSPMERMAWEVMAAQVAARGEPFKARFDPDALASSMRGKGFGRVDSLPGDVLNARYLSGRSDGLAMRASTCLMRAWVQDPG